MKTLPSRVRSLYVSGVASTGISLLSWFEQDRHPVGQLRHAAEEKGAFRDEHRRAELARAQSLEAMRQPRDRRGDMALRGREAGEAVLALEVVEPLAGKLAGLDGQGSHGVVVPLGDVAGSGGLGDLGVVELGGEAVDVRDPAAQAL